jgi:hypothetical protein
MDPFIFLIPGVIAGAAMPLVFAKMMGHSRRRAVGESVLVLAVLSLFGLMIGLSNTQSHGSANWDALVLIYAVFTNGASWLVATFVTAAVMGGPSTSPGAPS